MHENPVKPPIDKLRNGKRNIFRFKIQCVQEAKLLRFLGKKKDHTASEVLSNSKRKEKGRANF